MRTPPAPSRFASSAPTSATFSLREIIEAARRPPAVTSCPISAASIAMLCRPDGGSSDSTALAAAHATATSRSSMHAAIVAHLSHPRASPRRFSRPCGARACSASSPTDLPVNGARSRSKGTAFRMCLPKSDLYRVCLHCLIPGAPSCSTPGVSSTWSGVNAIFPEERGISIDHAPAAHHDIVNVCGEAVLGRPPTRDLRASRRVAPLHHAALRLGRPPPWSGAHWWLHL